jgi:hypothetical protein
VGKKPHKTGIFWKLPKIWRKRRILERNSPDPIRSGRAGQITGRSTPKKRSSKYIQKGKIPNKAQ